MSAIEPKYDEDSITYGFLKKVLGEDVKDTSKAFSLNYSKNYGTTPSPPYKKGDTWNNNDNIYICINSRDVGNSIVMSDWQLLFDKETNKIISNNFQFLSAIKLEKNEDGKIETFYQSDEPSRNWSNEEKSNHIGDYYQNSIDFKTYIYSSEKVWKEVEVSTIIFDNINGHRNIFTKRPVSYNEGDIWKVNNLEDIDLFSNVSINDFVQARKSNLVFNENDWKLISNELNIKANLYTIGGQPVAANNVLSNLQYSSFGKHNGYGVLGFDEWVSADTDTSGEISTSTGLVRGYSDISIDIDLPDNFKVISAFLSVFHSNIFWSYYNAQQQAYISNWGASKNIKLYKMNTEKNMKLLYQNSLTYREKINTSDLIEIPNAFGSTSHSFTTNSNTNIERKDTINLKNYINKNGKTKLVLRTSDTIPTDSNLMTSNTGMAKVIVNVLGYIDLKGSGN